MKKTIFTIAFLGISLQSYSQQKFINEPCSRKIYYLSDNPDRQILDFFKMNMDSFIYYYTIKYFSGTEKHLTSDKNELDIIPLIQCYNSELLYISNEKNNIKIEIKIRNQLLCKKDSNLVFEFPFGEIGDSTIYNVKRNEVKYWGDFGLFLDKKDTIRTEIIYSLDVIFEDKKIYVPIEIYNDLINPNYLSRYKSFRPIEVYYSQKMDAVYIYLYGDKYKKSLSDDEFWNWNSYLCKIIIDKNGTCRRIVIPISLLNHYGWFHCDDLWIF